MAAMRARRGRREPEPPRGRRRPAPPPPGMSKLGLIKLNGGLDPAQVAVSSRSLMLGAAGLVLFSGVAIAGAAFMGNSLFDAREAFTRAADGAAADLGFAVGRIEIAGVSGARAEEVRAVIVPVGRQSILSLDPVEVKARIEALDWVAAAHVRRLWPSTIEVEVERRQAYARWQEDGEISVIDYNGARLLSENAADHADLPLVVGAGAGPEAEPLLLALEQLPQVRARLRALVRVGERRWNVELVSGAVVALPEANAAIALAQLETLQAEHQLLDRPVAQFDLRMPGRLAVRLDPALSGAPASYAGGA